MTCIMNQHGPINKFYLYDEVVIHNTLEDFWVVIHNNVLNLTPMLKDRRDSWTANLEYLLAFGGKDLSSYFYKNGKPRTEISIATGKKRVIFPPIVERAESLMCRTPSSKYWSLDQFYHIGKLTIQERPLRIINTLTGKTTLMKVCEEDTIYDIQRKYKKYYNNHAGSYVWRKDYKNGTVSGHLSLNANLTHNGLIMGTKYTGIPPALWLFYTDDYTIG